MPRPLCWPDLAACRAVGVWGLGVEGTASIRALRALGVEPVLVDDSGGTTAGGDPVLPTAGGGLEALAACEVVVKTPGISRYRPEVAELRARGVRLTGGLGLWLQGADRSRVVCVTGTKGKSTTTAVAGHLLDRLGYRCLVAGNIGRVPYDPDLPGGTGWDYCVVEVSSYQATDLTCAPPVVAVTSLHPDHLDWHRGEDNYVRDKLSVCTLPGAALTVANGDSTALRERRALLGPRVRWVGEHDEPGARWMAPLGLLGGHNRRNALIARACLRALGVPEAGDDAALEAAACGFEQLDSRLRVIGTVAGVTFVDDSLSTNVLPTLAAVDAFAGQRVALIAGGHDRGIDYAPLAEGLSGRAAGTLVVTLPDNGPRIEAALRGHVDTVGCPDLPTAVARAFGWARPDGVVLLSPAAPSFGRFRDYRERAAAFAAAMRALPAQ